MSDEKVTWPECSIAITGNGPRRYIEFVIGPTYEIKRVTPDEEFNKVMIVIEPQKNITEKIQ